MPAYYPVPTSTRQFPLSACLAGSRRGWTLERQADFLGILAATGSVIGACEAVGISRKSAYRLRALPGADRAPAPRHSLSEQPPWPVRPLGPFA
jgi:hypothetical protein